jgi:hypothetical protein
VPCSSSIRPCVQYVQLSLDFSMVQRTMYLEKDIRLEEYGLLVFRAFCGAG